MLNRMKWKNDKLRKQFGQQIYWLQINWTCRPNSGDLKIFAPNNKNEREKEREKERDKDKKGKIGETSNKMAKLRIGRHPTVWRRQLTSGKRVEGKEQSRNEGKKGKKKANGQRRAEGKSKDKRKQAGRKKINVRLCAGPGVTNCCDKEMQQVITLKKQSLWQRQDFLVKKLFKKSNLVRPFFCLHSLSTDERNEEKKPWQPKNRERERETGGERKTDKERRGRQVVSCTGLISADKRSWRECELPTVRRRWNKSGRRRGLKRRPESKGGKSEQRNKKVVMKKGDTTTRTVWHTDTYTHAKKLKLST